MPFFVQFAGLPMRHNYIDRIIADIYNKNMSRKQYFYKFSQNIDINHFLLYNRMYIKKNRYPSADGI